MHLSLLNRWFKGLQWINVIALDGFGLKSKCFAFFFFKLTDNQGGVRGIGRHIREIIRVEAEKREPFYFHS